MNVKEALEWSKANGGRHVSRAGPDYGTQGWIAWSDDNEFIYQLTFEDLTATDWAPSAEMVERITGGRWKHVEPKPEGAA